MLKRNKKGHFLPVNGVKKVRPHFNQRYVKRSEAFTADDLYDAFLIGWDNAIRLGKNKRGESFRAWRDGLKK